ncbi:aminopeptidase N [Engelhardtia mirabilis]|uniref:Aminopeptidase N n=1 Tax=Engelhardtia mirabilis TaxID=2528011 RepID=A0A518BNN3_9BACT|nr:Aminopeptidase N [Planctomycetes bacterium Pla133]QDV02909.1 Aminopeptidase N [Planctomycetes bacterium Pla86]
MTALETAAEPREIHRLDYRPPTFWVDSVALEFDLGEEGTVVTARLSLRRNDEVAEGPLELDGEELETLSVAVDGRVLGQGEYTIEGERLTIPDLPARCELETKVRIHPESNTQLSGLYLSSGNFCTQCEAEGFRRITWFLDRPDVMATYTVAIRADKQRYPVLLSNGNRVGERDLGDGRHEVRWEDPFVKPSYLFALVAGQLASHAGDFTTVSGRTVRCEIWVEAHNLDKCDHALRSLQAAMRWDEEQFGREYDLDLYMIVAVDDFNMGAMENKGLNIFNSKFVLARPDTATDDDYEGVEGVVAHEYFHNWTGNRVTCRDWFQLTLKEGLTVFRDQRFSADMGSEPVKRIEDVAMLRLRQYAEDAGPMAHPIRPESYISMDNFYTATVYEKGSEVIRMVDTLLGRDGFRRGMDLYFERHDGQAVTCDDFRAAMADANGRDLAQFERWYTQAGTPRLVATGRFDAAAGTYSLTLRQECPTGQREEDFRALHMPIRMGLIGPDGADQPLGFEGEAAAGAPTERVLELTEREQTFVFAGLTAEPVPSLARGLSAPVLLELEEDEQRLAFRLAHDSDAFNRWDAGQRLFGAAILAGAAALARGDEFQVSKGLVEAFRAVVTDPSLDGSMRSLAMALPSELELAQRMEIVDPDALHRARRAVRRALAEGTRTELAALWERAKPSGAYSNDRASIDRRREANVALAYLSCLESPEWTAAVAAHFDGADNMTDSQAALATLCQLDVPDRQRALEAFYAKWKGDPLVLDKWFTLQATSVLPGAPTRVAALAHHPDFTWRNPNRVRSVVGAFAMANHSGFHSADGSGYTLVADAVIELQGANPQLASRLAGSFNHYKRYDQHRQQAMRGALERIAAVDGLSKDVYEIVHRALA